MGITEKEFALSIKRISSSEGFRNLINYLQEQIEVWKKRGISPEISDVRVEKLVKKKATVYITIIDKDETSIILRTYQRILHKLEEALKMEIKE